MAKTCIHFKNINFKIFDREVFLAVLGGDDPSKHNKINLNKVVSNERFISFSFFVNDEKRKRQLYCLCLKMTADFGNFVAKNDKKRKTKDEMNPAYVYKQT